MVSFLTPMIDAATTFWIVFALAWVGLAIGVAWVFHKIVQGDEE